MDDRRPPRTRPYLLTGADGSTYESASAGRFGGNRRDRIYGAPDCPVASSNIARFKAAGRVAPYVQHRVWFADEATAQAAGYRPCGSCLRAQYLVWKAGPQRGVPYPWRIRPGERTRR
ncbi:MAG: metal-binding protein [Gemmatimonadetes bacterium]|nr:metal-binding protein [Gemmatimonadota bacterium]